MDLITKNDEKPDFAPRSLKIKADQGAQIKPATAPQAGFTTLVLDQVIAAGPAGLRRAQRTALRYAKRYLEDAADPWKLETEWLKSFDTVHRARARYALMWRPRFLAALSMCHSPELAALHTRISCQMAYYHRKHDAQFAKQWDQAREYGIDLLHGRVWQRALEGDLEPVQYMGITTGYIRKFSDKLQIELLRAYRPERFKTPGANINIGTRGDVFVLTEEQRHELQRINRERIERESLEGDSAHSTGVEYEREALTTPRLADAPSSDSAGDTLALPARRNSEG